MRRDTTDTVFPRWLLRVLSLLYGAGVGLRSAAFAIGLLRSERAEVPVISVGNLTAGGTGKTPLVGYLAGHLAGRGHRVGVVSRGYGRGSTGVVVVSDGTGPLVSPAVGGDEPVQIAARVPGVLVVVGERRVDAARVAVGKLGATVLLMDDGFQHRFLERDLDIVTIRGDREREALLPLGRRREPLRALGRAGFVVVTGAEPGDACADRLARLRRWYGGPCAAMAYRPEALVPATGAPAPADALRSARAYAFCGIGDPEGFLRSLADAGIPAADHLFFGDHHAYTERDLDEVLARARAAEASVLITTEKDAVRLGEGARMRLHRTMPLYHLRVAAQIVEGEDRLLDAVDRALRHQRQ